MNRRVRFNFPATLEDVQCVAQSLRAFLSGHVPEDACDAIELGVVEALNNVVKHGMAGRAHAAVEMSVEELPASVVVTLLDSGTPIPEEAFRRSDKDVFAFDPENIDQLPVGGMGLALIKNSFEVVNYKVEDGINRLTLAKRLGSEGGGDTFAG